MQYIYIYIGELFRVLKPCSTPSILRIFGEISWQFMAPPATTAEAAAFALRRSRGDRGQPGTMAGCGWASGWTWGNHGGTMAGRLGVPIPSGNLT